MRHLIDPMDLSVEDIDRLLDRADDIAKNPEKYQEVCKHKKLATLFFEPSTRTRLSFEAAMLELGGSVLGFSSADSSSASKGESVADTARVIECYADIIAMRHPKEGAPYVASQYVNIPIINAGDGGHNHPTQTLTDLLTIRREKGRLNNFTIGFCGDLKFGRTVHSLIDQFNVYKDMKARTNGEIYIGVVGPVRTGKSTFIKRFMNLMVLPNIENENDRNRANDELPQSSSGKTIMTTEPKFVPNEAVSIKVEGGIELIKCAYHRLCRIYGARCNGAYGGRRGTTGKNPMV